MGKSRLRLALCIHGGRPSPSRCLNVKHVAPIAIRSIETNGGAMECCGWMLATT
jgi:hypothetical protein